MKPASAVILSKTGKKPTANPWQIRKKVLELEKLEKAKMLSPDFQHKQILSAHHPPKGASSKLRQMPQAPKSAGITVGALYGNNMEYGVGDHYNTKNLVSSQRQKNRVNPLNQPQYQVPPMNPARTGSANGYGARSEQKVNASTKSMLNPNALTFTMASFGQRARHSSGSRGNEPRSAPALTRPQFYELNQNPSSAPFDPHSQLQNGGVFAPHPALGGLGTHISPKNSKKAVVSGVDSLGDASPFQSGYTDDAYNPNRYPYDEYKQAPTAGDHGDEHRNSYSGYDQYGDGDEKKVVDAPSNEASMDRHPWICPSCSFLNEIGSAACELCSSVRPIDESDEPQGGSLDEGSLDFDFNIEEIMNETGIPTSTGNDTEGLPNGSSLSVPVDKTDPVPDVDTPTFTDATPKTSILDGLSFNSLFFGDYPEETALPDLTVSCEYEVGQMVRYKSESQGTPIQGVVVEIRDESESLYPIRIEYEEHNRQKFMWVLPQELAKIDSKHASGSLADQRYNDALYDYDSE